MRKNIKYKDYVVENKEKKTINRKLYFSNKDKNEYFLWNKKGWSKRNKEELKKNYLKKL